MKYLSRLARSGCEPLISLLNVKYDDLCAICESLGCQQAVSRAHGRTGFVNPWVDILISDCLVLYDRVNAVRTLLPFPAQASFAEWWTYARDSHKDWNNLVASLFFLESAGDGMAPTSAAHFSFKCQLCNCHPFETSNGLKSHLRRKHGVRCDARLYTRR